jgi:transcriptional regulator with XRE-family HTH domain
MNERNLKRKTYRLVLRFTENLLKILEVKGIKNPKSHLAEQLGTSLPYISKVFNGSGNFTVYKMVELAEAVGAEIEVTLKPVEIKHNKLNLGVTFNRPQKTRHLEFVGRADEPNYPFRKGA